MYDSSTKEAAAEKYARAARAEQTAKLSAPQEKSTPAIQAQKQSPFAPDENIPEKIVSLENDKMRINFTNKGAAIKNVELREYPKSQGSKEPFVFNDIDARVPAMGLSIFDNAQSEIPLPIQNSFAHVDWRRMDEAQLDGMRYVAYTPTGVVDGRFAPMPTRNGLPMPYLVDEAIGFPILLLTAPDRDNILLPPFESILTLERKS